MTDLDDIIAGDPQGGRPPDVDNALARLRRAYVAALYRGDEETAADIKARTIRLLRTFELAAEAMSQALKDGKVRGRVEEVSAIGAWSQLAESAEAEGLTEAASHLRDLAAQLALLEPLS